MIDTDRLFIRDVRPTDADAFFDFMQREDYWRNLPIDPPTRASMQTLIERRLSEQTATPRVLYILAAVDKATDKVVGEAILRVTNLRHRNGEVGWAVAWHQTGKNLGTEIGRAMIRFGFDQLDLHRISARCRVGNTASQRIMTKLGMQYEGIAREDVNARDEWWSSSQWSILRGDSARP
ncbi:MAG TPA: GNAT family N-acetyltransferase [Magnetospirillaceae bacterium]